MKFLDLFCGYGGSGKGIMNAGCEVTGIDIDPKCKEYYPGRFIEANLVREDRNGRKYIDITSFRELDGSRLLDKIDAVDASCPCQHFSKMTAIRGDFSSHPDLIGMTRDALDDAGKPYWIENVLGAPLRQDVIIYGYMVDLPLLRPRAFECSFPVEQPPILSKNEIPEALRQHYSVVGRLVSTKRRGGNERYLDMKYWWPIQMGIDWIPVNLQTSSGQNEIGRASCRE